MRRFAITIIWLSLIALCVAELANAGDFTVDERSALHYSFSAAFGAGADVLVYNTSHGIDRGQRVFLSTVMGSMPGLVKEGMLDAHFDYGDMTFNVLGAFCGAIAADYVQSDMIGWIYGDGKRVFFGLGRRF